MYPIIVPTLLVRYTRWVNVAIMVSTLSVGYTMLVRVPIMHPPLGRVHQVGKGLHREVMRHTHIMAIYVSMYHRTRPRLEECHANTSVLIHAGAVDTLLPCRLSVHFSVAKHRCTYSTISRIHSPG